MSNRYDRDWSRSEEGRYNREDDDSRSGRGYRRGNDERDEDRIWRSSEYGEESGNRGSRYGRGEDFDQRGYSGSNYSSSGYGGEDYYSSGYGDDRRSGYESSGRRMGGGSRSESSGDSGRNDVL